MKQELLKAVRRIHKNTWYKTKNIKCIGSGSFRCVYSFNKDLAIKKDDSCEGVMALGDNDTELKQYKKIISHRNKNLKHLILPLLGHVRIGKSLYLIYPYVLTVDKVYYSNKDLTIFQKKMFEDCEHVCGDARDNNVGILKNTVMLIDYATYFHFPSRNKIFKFLRMPSYKRNISEVNSYIKKLKLKYLL